MAALGESLSSMLSPSRVHSQVTSTIFSRPTIVDLRGQGCLHRVAEPREHLAMASMGHLSHSRTFSYFGCTFFGVFL